MAGVELEVEGDPRLPIITEVYRPFLEKNFRLNATFRGNLASTFDNHNDILSQDTVTKLLDYLAEANKKGTYVAFLDALRHTGEGTDSFKYLADFIEGSASAVEESKCREFLHHLLKAFFLKFCDINPYDIITHIEDISTEEREIVIKKTDNYGYTQGAVELFGILLTKGMNCFLQLITALRQGSHVTLAEELSEMIRCDGDEDTCKKLSSKLPGIIDADTCTVVDKPVIYMDGNPSDDNASGCDSLMSTGVQGLAAGELNLACTPDSSVRPGDLNLNISQNEKSQTPAKEILSKSDDVSQEAEQADDDDTPGEESPQIIPIELRGYQKELVAPGLQQGKNAVIVAPTGSGKTVVAARLAKAVIDKEPGVGPRTGNCNPPNLVEGGSNKVIFIVNKVPLVKQQCDLFKQYIAGNRIMGLTGEMGHIGSLVDLLEQKDVLVMTAQILVNALQGNKDDNDPMELSKIGLLILDECHHCQKGDPYNEIMAEYCALKLSSPQKERPQVLGLTASMGVGKAKTRYKAQTHILTLCANLDAEKLCTVQDPANLEELKRKRDKPTEVILPVPERKSDSFKKVIETIMAKIEDFIIETPGGEIIRKECSELKCPPYRGTQVYEQWLVRMEDYIAGQVEDDGVRMSLVTCVDSLKVYNNSLYINRDARIQDALDHLQKHLECHEGQDIATNPFEQQILALFNEKKDRLQEISNNPANKNPLLDCLSKTLIKALAGKEHSRGILFCKTRAATEALLAWIEDNEQLKFLNPGKLIGCGGTGMTQKQQTEVLSRFRDGYHQLIVVTSVAEEGLDIQQCNVVIRYNYISNDIGRVQAQGRNRAKEGKFYLIVSEELNLHEREFMNQIREKMMFEATQNIQNMTEVDFLEQIAKIQKDNKLELKLKKFNSRLLKRNKKLMKVHLICRKCGAEACTADDIKCIQDAHHVVLSDSFVDRCNFVDIPARNVCADMELRKRITCGNMEKSCTQDWGNQMLYKGCIVNLISPKYFVMKMPKGPPRAYKKWKDVPFQIAKLSLEELDKICNASSEEDDDDDDDDEEEQAGDSRVNGDGMEAVSMITTSVQPHHEIASME